MERSESVFPIKTLYLTVTFCTIELAPWEIEIPVGYCLIKEPTKMTENGVDVFKAVIGSA